MDLAGKTGLITGGSSGIGYASAKHALQNGAKTIIITGQNPTRLYEAQKSLSEFGQVYAYQWRANEIEDNKNLIDQIQNHTKVIDFVFANAGVSWATPLGELDAVETPIYTKYGMAENQIDEMKKQVASMVPLGRLGNTDEIVDAVVFLASDSSRYILGEEIAIDGGWSNL